MNSRELRQSRIIPARLKEARIARGKSLSELSEMIGVSSQAISQYELGTFQPSPEVLMKIVEALDFPLKFFRKPKHSINQNVGNSAVYFRAMKNALKKEKEAFKVRIEWADEAYQYLSKYIDFPAVDIPNFQHLLNDDLDPFTIEDIADGLREYWGIGRGPVPNLVDILQEKGIVICNIEFGTKKIDAFSGWYNNVPYIVHGTDKSSAVRSRFDLAHELGHLIMHSNISETDLTNKETLARIESEANCFAGAFLLPSDSFVREVASVSLEHFIILKKRWRVSIQAMIMRCGHLGILTDNQIKYLYVQINKRGFRTREPLDDIIETEKPYLFKQAIELLLESNLFTPDDLLDEFPLQKKEIDSLLFLPPKLLTRRENVLKLNLNMNYKTSQN